MIELAVQLWRYYLPNENREGWAEIVIGSNGFFAAVSDYGDYAYAWRHHGCKDARQFFLRGARDWHYFATKLGGRDALVYDGEGTAKAIRKHILDARRSQEMSSEDARVEWDRVEECEVEDAYQGFIRWCERTDLDSPWEFHAERYNAQIVAFCKRTLPRLAILIRAELEKEAAA